MTKVWLLWHREPYEGSSLRGVFATEELAREALRFDEVFGQDAEIRMEHAEWCCDVEEAEVLTALSPVPYGPARRYATPPGPGLISESIIGGLGLVELYLRPIPISREDLP